MKDVTIVIAGKSKQGKSSIAKLIQDELISRKINVRLFDNVNDENDDLENKPVLEKTDEQVSVFIKVVTTTRNLELLNPDQE